MIASRYMSVAEFKEYMHISRSKAYELVRRADFPKIRVGNKLLVDKEELDNIWLPNQRMISK